MRIQDTNKVLNEAKVARKIHSHETGEFEGEHGLTRFKSRVRTRVGGRMLRRIGMISAATAIVGSAVFMMVRRRGGNPSL